MIFNTTAAVQGKSLTENGLQELFACATGFAAIRLIGTSPARSMIIHTSQNEFPPTNPADIHPKEEGALFTDTPLSAEAVSELTRSSNKIGNKGLNITHRSEKGSERTVVISDMPTWPSEATRTSSARTIVGITDIDLNGLIRTAESNLQILGYAIETRFSGPNKWINDIKNISVNGYGRMLVGAKGLCDVEFLNAKKAASMQKVISKALLEAGFTKEQVRSNSLVHLDHVNGSTIVFQPAIFRSEEKLKAFAAALTKEKNLPPPDVLPVGKEAIIAAAPPAPARLQA